MKRTESEPSATDTSHKVCVAPMMRHTDRHFRYLLRLLSDRLFLYTEMITCGALLHGDTAALLRHDPRERPLALQLGGSDPKELARCARLAEQSGYDEINLNVGCPSDRVQNGNFGACLMREPETVANCVRALREACALDITVKCRIGTGAEPVFDHLQGFVETVSAAGCELFIVHARTAILDGLNPKQNRTIPPLRHAWVYRLKHLFPQLRFITNGGIRDLSAIRGHLAQTDGVMIGRAAYQDPWFLREAVQEALREPAAVPSQQEWVRAYLPYVEEQLREGVPLRRLCRHLPGLFKGTPGARLWRRALSGDGAVNMSGNRAGSAALRDALDQIAAHESPIPSGRIPCAAGTAPNHKRPAPTQPT